MGSQYDETLAGCRNIVQIIADDLGLMLGCYGNRAIQTPNIDKLAAEVHVGPHSVYPWEWYSASDSRDVVANAMEAGRFFDKALETARPFHLTIGYRDPHRDATRGGFGNDETDVAHIPVPDYKLEDVEIADFISDVPELRAELAEYYKAITRMDYGIGLVLKELEKRGLDQNTLVLFLSDNGAPFVNSKTTLYDAGVRLPLIVRQPGSGASGVVNPNIVSFLDILPTCIDWATSDSRSGTSYKEARTAKSSMSPQRLGQSFLAILDHGDELPPEQWPQQHVFGSHTFHEIQNYWPTRFMRSKRYKYHRNIAWKLDFPFGSDLYGSLSWEGLRNNSSGNMFAEHTELSEAGHAHETDTPEVMLGRRRLTSYIYRGPEELFDLLEDPQEIENLAGDPAHAHILVTMRAALEDWQYLTDDAWLMKDGASVIATTRYQVQGGLKLRDRFDFDAKDPSSAARPTATATGDKLAWKPRVSKDEGALEAAMGKMG